MRPRTGRGATARLEAFDAIDPEVAVAVSQAAPANEVPVGAVMAKSDGLYYTLAYLLVVIGVIEHEYGAFIGNGFLQGGKVLAGGIVFGYPRSKYLDVIGKDIHLFFIGAA